MSDKSHRYIGITIGPIGETLANASTPAALWAASYLFSMLARSLCEELVKAGVNKDDIVSPYYDPEDELLNQNNGVGLFHDRVIFRANGFDTAKLSSIRTAAVEKTAQRFGVDAAYLTDYFSVAMVAYEADNPVLGGSQMLDCAELAKPYVFSEVESPLLKLFADYKEIALTASFDSFSLRKHPNDNTSGLRSVSDIARTGKGLKKYRYYAIVRSDGDNMGQILSSLSTDSDVRAFSKSCLRFCSELAALVSRFDGVTIFSGGDDLLAILPCESRGGQTVFEFVAQANEVFQKVFDSYGKNTSLSLGVTMAYHKHPLYETLADSQNMLFGIAKQADLKNGCALRLQKHAGQSEGVFVRHEALTIVCELLNAVKGQTDDVLVSAMHKLMLFRALFAGAKDEQTIRNLFINTFDADCHQNNTFVQELLPRVFNALQGGAAIYAMNENGLVRNDAVWTLCSLLRICKFYIESEGERE